MAITLGLVEDVDDNGVYLSMPGSRGVLRGPFLTLQDVAVGDQVLAVTTDDGENVIVGQASAAAPRSTPASSTDNAVPRFDGTGGALQNSGVTIDDSNNVNITDASDVALRVIASTGSASLAVSAPAGADAGLQFRTGLLRRWDVNRAWDAESGSNAGSTFNINRYNDAGGWLSTSVSIDRATGRVTFGDVTTSSGIELGSGGPRITIGTGAPSHSAPNGSVYLRTDGTATTTLYVRAGGAWTALS